MMICQSPYLTILCYLMEICTSWIWQLTFSETRKKNVDLTRRERCLSLGSLTFVFINNNNYPSRVIIIDEYKRFSSRNCFLWTAKNLRTDKCGENFIINIYIILMSHVCIFITISRSVLAPKFSFHYNPGAKKIDVIRYSNAFKDKLKGI